ncbi:MAG: DUF928 domain-containing protein [Leptolyngbya sp. SIOISBB]|nr:DUF928 domain-containing protein [Leptolyngbya sp. SIOISBB]
MMTARKTSLGILSSILIMVPVGAAFAQASATIEETTPFQFSPPDDGLPDNTTGGASRPAGSCLMQQGANQAANITLLAPTSFVGITTSAHPEFLLYAEQTPVEQIFINIQDAQGTLVYQGFQVLSADTGFFTVNLPEDTPALEPDNTYQLSVVPICEATLRPDDPILTGYVKRIILPSVVEPSPQSSILETAQRYADSGVWYDTLRLIGDALSETPEDTNLLNAWNILLMSGGFSDSELNSYSF